MRCGSYRRQWWRSSISRAPTACLTTARATATLRAPMVFRGRIGVLLALLVALIGAAVPPVIEDHLEAGFCSADCPVQHDGHGGAIAPPLAALARRPAPVFVAASPHRADVPLEAPPSSDAPRAPPLASSRSLV